MLRLADVPDYESLWFARGFLVVPENVPVHLPSLDDWRQDRLCGYLVRTHPAADICILKSGHGDTWILLGHAYDPWLGEHEERILLQNLDAAYGQSEASFFDGLDRLSGRFVLAHLQGDGRGMVVQDAVGLKNLFFASTPNGPCMASHSQLLADALGLERDPDIDRLVGSWFYGVGIRHLPGLRTPFLGMGMLSANTLLRLPSLTVERFFPRAPHPVTDDVLHTAQEIAPIFAVSFDLLSRKCPLALSLSTGTDSRVSLAASRAFKDSVHYFSYASDPAEERDAVGARTLCNLLGIEHTLYRVPGVDADKVEGSEFSTILDHNAAYIRKPKRSERAKLHHLLAHFPKGMMEIKTHVSEIGRAFYCKKLGTSRIPDRLTARQMSNLYKRNLLSRDMLRFTDRAFDEFVRATGFGQCFFNYEQADMFYWEHRMSAWGSLANQDHDVLHDMTSLFNNRGVLKWLLSPSLSDRIADRLHHEMIRVLWPETLEVPLSNLESPKKKLRKLAERVFFSVNNL